MDTPRKPFGERMAGKGIHGRMYMPKGKDSYITFKNEKREITDHFAALHLLQERHNDRTNRYIDLRYIEYPHIEIQSFTGGYTRDELSGSERWRITEDTAEALWSRGYLDGKREVGDTNFMRLRLNKRGGEVLYSHLKALHTQEEAILKQLPKAVYKYERVILVLNAFHPHFGEFCHALKRVHVNKRTAFAEYYVFADGSVEHDATELSQWAPAMREKERAA